MLTKDLAATPNVRGKKTKIIVKYDVGFGNQLFIRGQGGELNWNKGIPMKNQTANEWVWETEAFFPEGEFKVLINDGQYETGPNHPLYCGSSFQYSPKF